MKKLIFGILILFVSGSANAFLSQGYNIEQLSEKSSFIFMGEVTHVVSSPVSNDSHDFPYIEVFFRVYESLKGDVSPVYSFKQFAPRVGKQFKLLGMHRDSYIPGQKLVMFLGSPSKTTGFSAPENFELFVIQSKSDRPSDIDQGLVFNKQYGEKIGQKLFQNLQKTSTINAMEKISKKSKSNSAMSFKDFRNLVQASIQ
jgi:hypothetical protein